VRVVTARRASRARPVRCVQDSESWYLGGPAGSVALRAGRPGIAGPRLDLLRTGSWVLLARGAPRRRARAADRERSARGLPGAWIL